MLSGARCPIFFLRDNLCQGLVIACLEIRILSFFLNLGGVPGRRGWTVGLHSWAIRITIVEENIFPHESGWWQLTYFLFSPRTLGEMNGNDPI